MVDIPKNFTPSEYVVRAVRNSDCRTPIIFVQEDGDPLVSVCAVAKGTQSTVWNFDLAASMNKTNIMDYIEVGVKNGDWVYIANCDLAEPDFFRDMARMLYHLTPQPDVFPRREFFRIIFCVQKPFDPNGITDVPFPTLLLNSSIIARSTEAGSKWTRMLPADDPLFKEAVRKRDRRRAAGRDSDSESDLGEDDQISGKLFYRSAELSHFVDRSPVTLAKEIFERAVEEQDVATIKKLIANGDVLLNAPFKMGMTALQYACCMQLAQVVVTLLELGADPNERRASDNCPPLFMALDDVTIAAALLDAGADMFTRYQGHRADTYPYTSLEVSAYLQQRRAEL